MRPAKRAFDLLWALPGLVLLAPLLAAIALCVKLGDRGPAFFGHERVGYRGRRFRLWKFRTMVRAARASGPEITVGDDARITPLGRWLRRLKLDELPQLLNVVAGEMSLVGPRPEVPSFVARYTPEQRAVLDLMPGITDPASIAYRDEARILARASEPERAYVEDILPHKIALSLEYAARATLWTDMRVIVETIALSIVRPRTNRHTRATVDDLERPARPPTSRAAGKA